MGPDGKYLYPFLPTINVGTTSRPVLVPPTLVVLPDYQSRSKLTPEMTAVLIKHAAVRPDVRMQFITDGAKGSPLASSYQSDVSALAFGLGGIEKHAMAVQAKLLPQAKLQYLGAGIVDPGLSGSWNIDRPQMKFKHPAPDPTGAGYMYGVMVVADRPPYGDWASLAAEFTQQIERDAGLAGIRLKQGGPVLTCSERGDDIKEKLSKMQGGGVRIVLVMMGGDSYGTVKLIGDALGVSTQCLKWKNINKPPRGYHANVMLKINTKMGGTNHSLISRLPPSGNPR